MTTESQHDINAPGEDVQAESHAEGLAPSLGSEFEHQVVSLKDELLRALAEAENIRRRCQKDVEDAAAYAIGKFANDLLNVADNLQRALAILKDNPVPEGPLGSVIEGVKLTQSELDRVFAKHGLVSIFPKGEKFDHQFHQAIFEVPAPGVETGTVVEVAQTGYMLHNRLLRPAMVGVARN